MLSVVRVHGSSEMPTGHPRRVPEDEAATPDQVETAIEALTEGEAIRLRAFAWCQARNRGRLPDGTDQDDLLARALKLIIEGRRRWNPNKVSFEGFLMGAMRSLASQSRSAKIKDALQGADLETNVTKDPDGPEEFHTVASSSPDPEASLVQAEEQAAAQALLDEIYSHLGEDWQVRLVIDGWREGHAGPALRANLGLSEREYNTITRRIRRKVGPFREARRSPDV